MWLSSIRDLLLSEKEIEGKWIVGKGRRGGARRADREEIVVGISCVRGESIFDFKKNKNEHLALSAAIHNIKCRKTHT